jgi:hypothetical protein
MRMRKYWRRATSRSWILSKWYYRLHGLQLSGRASDTVWYFAYGSNMHDGAFLKQRLMRPTEWRVGRLKGLSKDKRRMFAQTTRSCQGGRCTAGPLAQQRDRLSRHTSRSFLDRQKNFDKLSCPHSMVKPSLIATTMDTVLAMRSAWHSAAPCNNEASDDCLRLASLTSDDAGTKFRTY